MRAIRIRPLTVTFLLLVALLLPVAGGVAAASPGQAVWLADGAPETPSVPAPPLPPTPGPTQAPNLAHQLLATINRDRAAHHAPPLALDGQQSQCSRSHSRHMAGADAISHDQFPADVCVAHMLAAENVGMGSGAPADVLVTLERLMMAEGPCPHRACQGTEYASHGHFLNLTNPAFRRVGLGIYSTATATWLTEDFVG